MCVFFFFKPWMRSRYNTIHFYPFGWIKTQTIRITKLISFYHWCDIPPFLFIFLVGYNTIHWQLISFFSYFRKHHSFLSSWWDITSIGNWYRFLVISTSWSTRIRIENNTCYSSDNLIIFFLNYFISSIRKKIYFFFISQS